MSLRQQHYARFVALTDREALGADLSSQERAEIGRIASADDRCGDEHALYEALEEWVDAPNGAAVIPGLVDRVLAAEHDTPSALPQRRRRASWLYAAAGSTLAAAAAAILWVRPPAPPALEPTHGTPRAVRAELVYVAGSVELDGTRASVGQQVLAMGAEIAVTAGRACIAVDPGVGVCLDEGARVRIAELQLDQRRVEVLAGRVVATLQPQPPGSTFALSSGDVAISAVGTVFAVEISEDNTIVASVLEGVVELVATHTHERLHAHQRAQLARGTLVVESLPRADEATLQRIVEPLALLAQGEVGVLHVRTQPPGAAVELDGKHLGRAPIAAFVAAGPHELSAQLSGYAIAEPVLAELVPGQQTELEIVLRRAPAVAPADAPNPEAPGNESAPRKVASAEQLIAQAQRLRSQGKRRQAARAYRALITAHPRRPEARVALISLGDLQLQLGSAQAALRSYDRYLAQGRRGALVEEAQLGRIRALRAIGRRERERTAIEAFLRANPRSWEAARLQQRLVALNSSGTRGDDD